MVTTPATQDDEAEQRRRRNRGRRSRLDGSRCDGLVADEVVGAVGVVGLVLLGVLHEDPVALEDVARRRSNGPRARRGCRAGTGRAGRPGGRRRRRRRCTRRRTGPGSPSVCDRSVDHRALRGGTAGRRATPAGRRPRRRCGRQTVAFDRPCQATKTDDDERAPRGRRRRAAACASASSPPRTGGAARGREIEAVDVVVVLERVCVQAPSVAPRAGRLRRGALPRRTRPTRVAAERAEGDAPTEHDVADVGVTASTSTSRHQFIPPVGSSSATSFGQGDVEVAALGLQRSSQATRKRWTSSQTSTQHEHDLSRGVGRAAGALDRWRRTRGWRPGGGDATTTTE